MANEYLKRTPTSTGNRRVWTWSGWVKRNILYTSNAGPYLFDAGTSGSQFNGIRFLSDSSSCLDYNNYPGSTTHAIRSEPVYRDAGSWMHVLVAINTTSNTASDRLKMYVNGSRITDFRSSTYPSINDASSFINAINTHYIGRSIEGAYRYLEGEMSDVFLVDGQALEPDVFGFYKDGDGYMSSGTTKATDFRPGQWSPRLPKSIKHTINRSGGFGVNGFYLPMNDSSNPGADFHCTPNSIIKLKGEDLPQPRNGAPTTSDSFISEVRKEIGELGFAGVVKFDGSGDYLEIPDSDDFDFGSGDFTVEAFIEGARGGSSTNSVIFNQSTGSASSNSSFYFGAGTNGISLYLSTSGSSWTNFIQCGNITSLANNGFHHVVWQRRSNTLEIYVDGILQPVTGGNASFTGTIFNSSRVVDVGRQSTSGSNFNGFISNLRVVKGTAVYTGNFTAPTEPLTNVTNTKLLCCNSSTSATAATVTPGTITANGNAFATTSELTGSIVVAVPGISGGTNSGYGDYSGDIRGSGSSKSTINDGSVAIHTFPSHYGSGMRFSGSGNSNATGGLVKINSVSDFELGLGDFTLEGWLYAHVNNQDSGVFGIGSGGSEVFLSWTQGTLKWRQSGGTLINSPSTITHDQWHHVVLQSRSQLCSLIVNGVTVGSATNTHVLTGGDFIIGSWSTSKVYGFDGDIQDVRLYKGVAKYKGGFDVSKPYTPVGIEAFRTTADTCKNNFATLNSLAAGSKYGLLDGNLSFTSSTTNWTGFIGSTHGFRAGKWYWEKRINVSTAYHIFGIMDNEIKHHDISDAYFYGMTYQSDGRFYGENNSGAAFSSGNAAAQTVGDVVMLAVDMDAKKMWLGINGSWLSSGNPSTGANANWNSSRGFTDGHYYTPVFSSYGSSGMTANFGQNPSFSDTHAVNRNRVNTSNSNSIWHQSSNSGTHTDWTISSDGTNLQVSVASGAYARAYLQATDGTIDSKKKYIVSFDYVSGPANLGVQGGSPLLYLTATDGSVAPSGLSAGNRYAFIFQGSQFAFTGFTGSTYHLNDVVVSEVGEGYTDSNGIGKFAYQPPSGYLALCEDNLPAPAIADPGEHFKCVLYTGDGNAGLNVSKVGFQPDMVWIKNRDSSLSHNIYDSVRGPAKRLQPDLSNAESDIAGVSAFSNDGFNLGNGTNDANYTSGQNYVAWCWKAGGRAVSNSDGSITSQVSANRTAGFSIVSYTGNNTTNSTVGHGLGKTPSVVITKSRSNPQNPAWHTSHVSLAPNYDLALDSNTAAWTPTGNGWHELTSSSVFTLKNGSSNGYNVNRNGDNYIAYCWAEIEGFSKFGSYVGNQSTDGPFVYCGFKPAFIIRKRTTSTAGWYLTDSSRNPTNPVALFLDASDSGNSGNGTDVDFLSNGFKLRNADAGTNYNSNTYIFMAFAESPFQTANAK